MQLNHNIYLLFEYIQKVYKRFIKDINQVTIFENLKNLFQISALNKLAIFFNRNNYKDIFKEKNFSDLRLKTIYLIPF